MRRFAATLACFALSGCVAAVPAAVIAPVLVAKGAALAIAPVVMAHSTEMMAGSAAVQVATSRNSFTATAPADNQGPGYDW